MTTLQDQRTGHDSDRSDSSNGDNDLSDEECDDDTDPSNVFDQDEDVICAAEEAQQEDLDDVEETAEIEIMVAGSEQETASTTLSKVSCSIHCPNTIC